MNVEITGVAPVTPPEQRVVLDLSVEEFAMLEHLRYNHLAGDTSLRGGIDEGFGEATALLARGWRERVDAARARRGVNNSQVVERVFRA